jgi:hypothetical protein
VDSSPNRVKPKNITLVFVASSLSTQHGNFQCIDDEIRFLLDQQALFDFFYSTSLLKQQFADRHVAPLRHIILIPSQPVFAIFLLNAACLAKKQQTKPVDQVKSGSHHQLPCSRHDIAEKLLSGF